MTASDRPAIRSAGVQDLEAMLRLETACFTLDAQSRRSMTYLLSRANAETRVIDGDSGLAGYAMLLFRRGSQVARLYSIAVDPAAQGRGLAATLLDDAVMRARARGCTSARAEARQGNVASRALFRRAGFIETGVLSAYYPGGEDGVRMQRALSSD